MGYDPERYGRGWAEIYDDIAEMTPLSPEDTVADVIAELAGGGRVLELAIGTGRLALPIAARGVEIHGVDASAEMVDRMRSKPGGEDIPVTMGDFAEPLPEGPWAVVLLAFNTLFALPDQDRQLDCFREVAAVLAHDGVFVVECFVPDLGRFDRNQRVGAIPAQGEGIRIEVSLHDPVAQTVTTKQLLIEEGEAPKILPVDIRYAWPTEIDLMARLSGLELRERWGSFDREPFTAASVTHVSVYRRV
jgi:SAM-dependent methyltransferase